MLQAETLSPAFLLQHTDIHSDQTLAVRIMHSDARKVMVQSQIHKLRELNKLRAPGIAVSCPIYYTTYTLSIIAKSLIIVFAKVNLLLYTQFRSLNITYNQSFGSKVGSQEVIFQNSCYFKNRYRKSLPTKQKHFQPPKTD